MRGIKRRGRPPLKRPKKDEGTAELQAKREAGLTQLPVDLCLSRGKLSQREHDAASRLKWLHSLQYGVAVPAQVKWDMTARQLRERDQVWLAKRKQEYEQAVAVLERRAVWHIIKQVCIFECYPPWLVEVLHMRKERHINYHRLRKGLSELAKWWEM